MEGNNWPDEAAHFGYEEAARRGGHASTCSCSGLFLVVIQLCLSFTSSSLRWPGLLSMMTVVLEPLRILRFGVFEPLLKELGMLVLSVSLLLFLGVLHRDSGVGSACLVSLSSGMLLIVCPTFLDIWSKPCAHWIHYIILMVRMNWLWEEGGEEYLLRCMKCGLARG